MSEPVIRFMRLKDVDAVAEIEQETFARPWSRESFRQEVTRNAVARYLVAEEEGKIVGCGAIGPYWGKEDESSLFTVFVHPDFQGKGAGRAIVETLEADEYALRARRIEIPASITGLPFYQKMGYSFKDGKDTLDEEQLYRLEKYRT